jgi:hypothetical protein
MKIHALIIAFIVMITGGCASTETVKEAEGEGISRSFSYAFEPVYEATISAAKEKELEVVESDKKSGRLILAHGVTLWSWGERIAVFVKPLSNNETEVEVVSKPVLAPLNFPPDWQNILLDQIEAELRTGR